MPEQMTMFFDDESDWVHADGWGHKWHIHACAMNQSEEDLRWSIGDGPRDGEFGIHAAGCYYRRDGA